MQFTFYRLCLTLYIVRYADANSLSYAFVVLKRGCSNRCSARVSISRSGSKIWRLNFDFRFTISMQAYGLESEKMSHFRFLFIFVAAVMVFVCCFVCIYNSRDGIGSPNLQWGFFFWNFYFVAKDPSWRVATCDACAALKFASKGMRKYFKAEIEKLNFTILQNQILVKRWIITMDCKKVLVASSVQNVLTPIEEILKSTIAFVE